MKYVVRDLNDPLKLSVVEFNREPDGSYGEAPIDPISGESERPEWLQIELVDNGTGLMVETITINETLKDQILAQKESKKTQDDSDRTESKDTEKIFYDYMDGIDPKDIKDIKDIRKLVRMLKRYFKTRAKRTDK